MKIPYVNVLCYNQIPLETKEVMKKALLNNVDEASSIIGSNNLAAIINDLKEKHQGYNPTLIERMIDNKIMEDYQTILKAMDLIDFYQKNGCSFDYKNLAILQQTTHNKD